LVVTSAPDEGEEYHDDDGDEGFLHADSLVSSQITSDTDFESPQNIPQTPWQRVTSCFAQAFHILCPSLQKFADKSFPGKIVSILAVPAVLALTLTLPIVVIPYENNDIRKENHHGGEVGRLIDFEEEGIERILIAEEEVQEEQHDLTFNKWLMVVQCVFGPLFCVAVLFSESSLSHFFSRTHLGPETQVGRGTIYGC
jgi:sodium/potassium/calcium exchanger 6